MKDSTRVTRRPWPPAARTAAAIIATASLSVPAPAFGSSPSSSAGGGSSNARAWALSQSAKAQTVLAYARCMRSHGVPKYPDPSSSNETASGLPKVSLPQLGVSLFQLQAAEAAAGACSPMAASRPRPRRSRC